MPAITKALRQPSRVPLRPNRNDSDAPMVKELVYQAAMRARLSGDVETRRKPARNPSEMGEKAPHIGQCRDGFSQAG